jgi:predicted HNH restriction endonuclease
MKSKMVLWKWEKAKKLLGKAPIEMYGNQLKYANKGDILYIVATNENKLFLLGKLLVGDISNDDGEYEATVQSLSGAFVKEHLNKDIWNLRFESVNDRLSQEKTLGQQLQANRLLTIESTLILEKYLKKTKRSITKDDTKEQLKEFRLEGEAVEKSLSVRERDPRIRKEILKKYGYSCCICGFNFKDIYGNYEECIEVHHLSPLAKRAKGEKTDIDDLIVLCPNCHRAIHKSEDPSDWKGLKTTFKNEAKPNNGKRNRK